MPRRTLKLAAEYDIPLAGSWSLRPRVDYYSQSGFWAREFNVPADRVGSWEQLDLQLQVANDDRDLALIFFVVGVDVAGYSLTGLALAVAALNAATGLCLGCKAFVLIRRLQSA